ncbi:Fe-S oxidoreductase [Enhygromyxa salina]|uniref:Fe-S oxidoreductase n=1 Tax=Enhygromyxa salina TaxID=215803 RepID=A0A0C2D3G3_9BACT|nr:hypothetical protein [Enhygromyxa salina]KIG16275.1 Fe-S oxidoreductase [Enhygromyxa salina]
MTDPESLAPTRLLDDPSLSGILRDDLQAMSAQAPLPYDVDAGLERFQQTIQAAPAGPSGTSVLGWVVIAAVLISGGVGAGWLASGSGAHETGDHAGVVAIADAHEDPVVAAPAAAAPSADLAAAAPSADLAADPAATNPAETAKAPVPAAASEPEPEPATAPEAHERPAAKPAIAPEPAPSLADEAKQINAGRKLLTSDPAQTLAIMKAAEQQFPNGAMIQERTGYTILALVALNRRPEAEQVATSYLQRWPNGPLARRVRDALGQ